jgi:hypothetical protein
MDNTASVLPAYRPTNCVFYGIYRQKRRAQIHGHGEQKDEERDQLAKFLIVKCVILQECV